MFLFESLVTTEAYVSRKKCSSTFCRFSLSCEGTTLTSLLQVELMNDADDQLDLWDKLKDELNEGKTVSAPKAKVSGKKRKMSGAQNSRKKPRIEADSDYDNSVDEDCDEETSDDVTSDDETGESLTEDQISSKISEIRGNKKKARQEKAELEGKIKALDAEIRALQVRVKPSRSRSIIWSICQALIMLNAFALASLRFMASRFGNPIRVLFYRLLFVSVLAVVVTRFDELPLLHRIVFDHSALC